MTSGTVGENPEQAASSGGRVQDSGLGQQRMKSGQDISNDPNLTALKDYVFNQLGRVPDFTGWTVQVCCSPGVALRRTVCRM